MSEAAAGAGQDLTLVARGSSIRGAEPASNGLAPVPWRALAIALVWGATLMMAVVLRSGEISGPLHLGGPHVDAARTPAGVVVQPKDQSYDGQFYYRMTIAPFSTDDWEHGIQFDAPALRASRVVFPLAAHGLSLGNISWAPISMLIVNILAIGAVGLAGAMLAQTVGRDWHFGLVFLVIPGVTYGLTFALADVVAVGLLLFGINAFLRRHWAASAVLFSVAAMTRESTLLVVGSITLVAAFERAQSDRTTSSATRRPTPWLPFVVPFIVFGAWQSVLYAQWGQLGVTSSGASNFALPLSTLLREWQDFVPRNGPSALRLFVLLTIVATVVLAISALSSGGDSPLFAYVGLAVGTVMFVSLGRVPFSNYVNFARAATELLVIAALVALCSRGRSATLALLALSGGGVVLAGWAVWATTQL